MTDTQEQQPPVAQLSQGQPASDETVIDLRYLFFVWLKWIWVPILLGGFGLYSGYRDIQAFTPQSVASITVAPIGEATERISTGVTGLAAQFGVQIDTRGGAISVFRRLQMMLGSVVFAEKLQDEIQILQVLYPGSWDEAAGAWTRPTGKDFERDQVRRARFKQNLWAPPNLETVANYLADTLIFEEVDGGPFQHVSVTHQDPEFALWVLTTAYFAADEMLREQDGKESAISRANIEAKMAVESKVQFLEALRGLLTNELSREITLDEGLPYAARIVEPARIHNRRTEPNLQRLMGVPAATYAGLGFFLTTLIALFRRERRRG